MAKVGPVVFTTGELERRLRSLGPFVRRQLTDESQRKRWVENEVRLEAIAQRAWAEGVQDEPEVRRKMIGLLVDTYTRRSMNAQAAAAEPTAAELLAAYQAREEEFNKPAKVRLTQIVRFAEGRAARRKARALLERVRRKVMAGQKKNDHGVFAQAAQSHSEDEATKPRGGELPFLTRSELAERYGRDLADRSFDEAEVGDLYIADLPHAVVLFRKIGRRRAIERTLEQVRPQLRSQLSQQKRQEAFDRWAQALLDREGVVIDQDALATLRTPEPEAPTPPSAVEDPPSPGDHGQH